jgi:hypothetical protein
MISMMKKQIIAIILLLFVLNSYSQNEVADYKRSSLYSMLISHPSQTFSEDIQNVFSTIPIPDKFDDHSLSVKIVSSTTKKQEEVSVVDVFIENNAIARRMVGKWFDRDPETGLFDMNLIALRGNYDATYFDVDLAKRTIRGTAQLADAGEELIGNTFLLVNDIKYIDRGEGAKVAGGIIKTLGTVVALYTGNSDWMDVGNSVGGLVEAIKGFKVTVTSHLYRLEWNDDIANKLYESYYMTETNFNADKKTAFENDKQLFKLKYVGQQSVNSGKTSIEGINTDTPEQMIRKVCTRAIDKSIVELQKAHEEFRVKTPIFQTGSTIQVKIGMKEGVTSDSRFEVLEQSIDETGKTQYKRAGIIRPVSGKIWDNRYMAAEERAEGADLTCTEFKKVSGDDFRIGMLIREIK